MENNHYYSLTKTSRRKVRIDHLCVLAHPIFIRKTLTQLHYLRLSTNKLNNAPKSDEA